MGEGSQRTLAWIWIVVASGSATTAHSIAVMRAVYSHPLPKERRGGTDAIAAALAKDE
jgi:hypothetical protein